MKEKSIESCVIEINPDQTVRDLVVQYPQLRAQLEKLGIDYCCGGLRPLSDAVKAAGLDWDPVENQLKSAWIAAQTEAPSTDWDAASLSALADHILEKHHTFTKAQLLRLKELLQKVQRAHGEKHGPLLERLRSVFNGLSAELTEHLMKEEQILFPAIKEIDAFASGTGERPEFHCGTVEHPIRQMMTEHDSAGEALVELRRLTDNYRLPDDACQTFAALYDGFQALEADLHEHIHLENNILFPKSLEQENSMRS